MVDQPDPVIPTAAEAQSPFPFSTHIDSYVERLEALHLLFASTMPGIIALLNDAASKADAFIDAHRVDKSGKPQPTDKSADSPTMDSTHAATKREDGSGSDGEDVTLKIGLEEFGQFKQVTRRVSRTRSAFQLFPEIILVSFISQ